MTDLAAPGSHYTHRVVDTAVRLVVEDGLPYRAASWSLWRDHRVFVPYATIQNWVEAGGEKGGAADRDRAPRLGAVGLLGLHRRRRAVRRPVLHPVDRRQPHLQAARLPGPRPRPEARTTSRPSSAASRPALEQRGLALRGITTDGSSLYPEPIAAVFGDVPHQLCTFHVLRELTKAVLGAVAKVRKDLAAGKPKLPRGRPATKAARRAARRKKRIEQKIGDAVRAPLPVRPASAQPGRAADAAADQPRACLSCATLRELMEEVYRLFDRRCRTDTALAKLATAAGAGAAVRPARARR